MTVPITLAAGDGGGIFFFIMIAVVGLINWIAEQKKKNAESQGPKSRPPTRAKPIQSGESEQERLRRFLEALGVPGGQAPPPPSAQPAPQTQAPATRSVPTLVQRPVPPPRSVPAPQSAPRPVAVQRPQPPVTFHPPEPLHFEEPHKPEVSVADQFAITSNPGPQPGMHDHPRGHEARKARMAPKQTEFVHGQKIVRPGAEQAAAIVAMLKSPDSLRKALVLREVLGPPPGLQS